MVPPGSSFQKLPQRVKGKQVKGLCELVTVNTECHHHIIRPLIRFGKADEGMRMYEPGNLP